MSRKKGKPKIIIMRSYFYRPSVLFFCLVEDTANDDDDNATNDNNNNNNNNNDVYDDNDDDNDNKEEEDDDDDEDKSINHNRDNNNINNSMPPKLKKSPTPKKKKEDAAVNQVLSAFASKLKVTEPTKPYSLGMKDPYIIKSYTHKFVNYVEVEFFVPGCLTKNGYKAGFGNGQFQTIFVRVGEWQK